MNRIIQFRGKAVKCSLFPDSEWVEGFYYEDLEDGETASFIKCGELNVKVIPKTVGQFTGLFDKNGKEIYEDDIVSVKNFTSAYPSPYIGKVIMRGGQWCVEYYKEYRCCPPLFFDDFADRKTEVIGNIRDNPELLEGGEK